LADVIKPDRQREAVTLRLSCRTGRKDQAGENRHV
jgi:hypothetical protein